MSTTETLCSWTEYPYSSYDKRAYEIEHRVVIERYDADTHDVRHEVRSSDDDSTPSTWAETEMVELRPHGMTALDGIEVMRS